MSQRLKLGDHLVSPRSLYTHHGLYIGKGKVIHYAGLANGLQGGPVKISTLEEFLAGSGYELREYKERKYARREAVARARRRLGESLYNPAFNNCEHFVEWCITGRYRSKQADIVMGVSGGLGGLLLSRGGAAAHAIARVLWNQVKAAVTTKGTRKSPRTTSTRNRNPGSF